MLSRRWIALIAVTAVLCCGACGTGTRLDTWGDGPGGGQFLPPMPQIDSGIWQLADGVFAPVDGGGANVDLFVPDQDVVPSFHVVNGSVISTGDATYDTDGNGVPDYIIFTMRPLSAQAAANVAVASPAGGSWTGTALADLFTLSRAEFLATLGQAGSPFTLAEDGSVFIKVGGCAMEPLDMASTNPVELLIPISAATETGATLTLYKFLDWTAIGRESSDDIGTGTGVWVELDNVVTRPEGSNAVSFEIDSFGQYCVATPDVTHDQGTGGSV